MSRIKTISFIGLGQMGRPMAKNLQAAGFNVVGYDASKEARLEASKSGLIVSESLDDAIRDSDCIVTMLPNGDIVQDVLVSNDRFLSANKGALLLEMSSSAPMQTRQLSEIVGAHLRVVDAPVSGGVKRAIEGTLTVMAGGSNEDIESSKSVLEAISSKVFSCGAVGAGHAMKSINNYVSGAGVVAASEAVRLGTGFGLEAETIVDVLNASSGKNNATEVKMKQFILNEAFSSGFALGLMSKDIGIAADLAKSLNLNLKNLEETDLMWKQASKEVGGAADHTRMFEFVTTSSNSKN